MTPISSGSWRGPECYLVPLVALLGLTLVAVAGGNQWLFLRLNGLSRWTGPEMWPLVTVLGDTLVALTLLLPLLAWRPQLVWSALVAGLMAGVTVHVLKVLVDMPRPPAVLAPELLRVIGPAYRADSFPSGHSTTIFTLAGILVPHLRGTGRRFALLLTATLVACSRSVVGLHWPADLLAGAALGWTSAVVGSTLAVHWSWGLRPWPRRLWSALLLAAAGALLLGYDSGYPSALWLQRAIAVGCIVAVGLTWYRRRHRSPPPG